jgi:hypothetical protein
VDELLDTASTYRSGRLAHVLHHFAGCGTDQDTGRGAQVACDHPALANGNGIALPYITVCVRATLGINTRYPGSSASSLSLSHRSFPG